MLDAHAGAKRTTKSPRDVAAAHHPHHLASDLFLEHGPPWRQAEAEPVIDHGETTARELSRADKLAADPLPLADGLEGEAAFGCQLPATRSTS